MRAISSVFCAMLLLAVPVWGDNDCPSGNPKNCHPVHVPCDGVEPVSFVLVDSDNIQGATLTILRSEEKVELSLQTSANLFAENISLYVGAASALPVDANGDPILDEFTVHMPIARRASTYFLLDDDQLAGCNALAVAVDVVRLNLFGQPAGRKRLWLRGTTIGNGYATSFCLPECSANNASYSMVLCSESLENVGQIAEAIPSGDDLGLTVPLKFPFKYYGQIYTNIGISTNGYLSFSSSLDSYVNAPIPRIQEPNALIAPLWTDLEPTPAGSITYVTVGVSPNRHFTVTWTDLRRPGSVDLLTFQATLFESDHSIQFRYHQTAPEILPGMYTIGVENLDGTDGTSTDAAVLASNTCLQISAPPLRPAPAPALDKVMFIPTVLVLLFVARTKMNPTTASRGGDE